MRFEFLILDMYESVIIKEMAGLSQVNIIQNESQSPNFCTEIQGGQKKFMM